MKKPDCIVIPVVIEVEHAEDCPQHPHNKAERERSGPSAVVTDEYRNGWESVFGNKQPVGQA